MKALPVILSLCAVACVSKPELDGERTAIQNADRAWLAAAQARNVDSTASFWTDDAHIIGPGQPPVIGKAAIRKMLTDGFAAPAFSVAWQTTDVVVAPSGDVAYSFGTNTFTVPTATTRVDTLHGQGVVVWQKGTDGRWRAAVDTWTPQPTR